MSLRLDWCSYEAAKYAVTHWHYSGTMPMGKLVKVGAWEDSRFIGVALFSSGSSRFYGVKFGLEMLEVSELARVALDKHDSYTSAVLARAIRMLKDQSPRLRLIVSFADPSVDHLGILYQAGNWIYCGRGTSDARVRRYRLPDGRVWQWRSMARYLNHNGFAETVQQAEDLGVEVLDTEPKHKYLYPLDRAMRRQIAPLAQPYPKRMRPADGSADSDQLTVGGSTPTRTLSTSDVTGREPERIP